MTSVAYFRMRLTWLITILFPALLLAQDAGKPIEGPTPAANEAAELAKKLANPIANLISVPFQNNTFYGMGAFHGTQNIMNFQPVIPVKLNENWNIITRVIVPIVTQYNITGENTSQSGLSDITASAFFSPSHTHDGLTWGIGPAFLIPTATNTYLGTGKFGIGPTAVILKQANGFTYGALINQIWSVAGASDRSNVSQLFAQPFFIYNWKSGAGIGMVGSVTKLGYPKEYNFDCHSIYRHNKIWKTNRSAGRRPSSPDIGNSIGRFWMAGPANPYLS